MAFNSPETELRETLIEILTAAFADEGFEFRDDKLHESIGHELAAGKAVGGVYPDIAKERPQQNIVQETTVMVQLFGRWERQIDPQQTVSPKPVEEWAERLRQACQQATGYASNKLWYFQVREIRYPLDPTGNITRLVATVEAHSDNPALVETTQ